MELSFAKGTEPVAETSLCFPGKVFDPAGSSFLSLGKLGADFRWDTIVCGLFDEDPTGVRITTFTDLSLSLAGATGVFSRDEPEEGHEFLGVFEAAEGSYFRDSDHGCDEFESFEGHHGIHEGFALPVV